MRKYSILFFILIIALFPIGCERIEKSPSVKTEVIDGIKHVDNTEEPTQGEISLDVAEILRIDPFDIYRSRGAAPFPNSTKRRC